jgi:ABC-2 type transport system ATP-binding protein
MLLLDKVNKTFTTEIAVEGETGNTGRKKKSKVVKTRIQAANEISFGVEQGDIFGFLGPNGAGKTTTIRMILDILRPDTGKITWNGKSIIDIPRRSFGYLPEERGLYPKMVVDEQLIFLARLLGTPKKVAEEHLNYWLERFDIQQNRKKKLEELSKGNQQKIQFLAAVLHDPEILIMDEPFSGLDPINVNQLKEAFLEMHKRGKTIIFSTHQMEQVEELCEDIVLINKGQVLLHGNLRDIKSGTGRKVVRLALQNDIEMLWLDQIPGVSVTKRRADYVELHLSAPTTTDDLLRLVLQRGDHVLRFELAEPSLNDIFIEKVAGVSITEDPNRFAAVAQEYNQTLAATKS